MVLGRGCGGGRARWRGTHPVQQAKQVIDLVRGGGYVEQAFEETRSRIKAADAAISTLPATETTGVFANVGEYLLERVESAGPSL